MAFRVKHWGQIELTDRQTGARRGHLDLRVHKEWVPPWQNASKPEGFPSIFPALAAASRMKHVGVIVKVAPPQDVGKYDEWYLGRFRVWETLAPKHTVAPGLVTTHMLPLAYPRFPKELQRIPRLTHVHQRISTSTYKDRLAKYRSETRIQSKADLAKQLIRDATDLSHSEINSMGVEGKWAIAHVRNRHYYKARSVNFNLFAAGRGYRGVTNAWEIDLACRERGFARVPVVSIALSQDGLESFDRFDMMFTLAHEAVHANDFYRVLHLIDRWRIESQRGRFFSWAAAEATHRNKSKRTLSPKDMARIVDLCDRKNYKDDANFPDFAPWEVKDLKPVRALGITTTDTVHFDAHFEGFRTRLWIVGSAVIAAGFAGWKTMSLANVEQEYVYFHDLDNMDSSYSATTSTYTQKLAAETIGRIGKLLRHKDFAKLRGPIKDYAQLRAAQLRKRAKTDRQLNARSGTFLDLVAKQL